MKSIPALLLLALTLAAATRLPAAEVPDGFNYQGRLVAASGAPLPDGNDNITFRLFTDLSGGEAVWGPQTVQVPLVDGLFNAVLGPRDSTNRDILKAFDGSDRYLELQIENNNPIAPRQRILSVPYAIRAQSASQADLADRASDADTVAGRSLAEVIFAGDVNYTKFDIAKIPDGITRHDDVPALVLPQVPDLVRQTLAGSPHITIGTPWPGDSTYALHVRQPATGRYAVFGDATSTSGTTYGLYGRATSSAGRAVYAHATSTNGVTYGVLSRAESNQGAAVYAHATSQTGNTFGVYALADSDAARAVYGHAKSTTGTTYGVWGRVSSPIGYAGYFTGGRNYFQGNVGIGTINPQAPLDITGNARITGEILDPNAPWSAGPTEWGGRTIALRTAGPQSNKVSFKVHQTAPSGPLARYLTVYVDGVEYLTAQRGKTFVIQHPTHDSRYLVHATLEGPENAVFYRGDTCLKDGWAIIALPHYFEALTHEDGRTVQLTAVDGFDRLAVQSQDGHVVSGAQFIVSSDNPHSTQRFMWEVKAVRKDIEPLEVEVSKEDAVLMGDGPYTYLLKKH